MKQNLYLQFQYRIQVSQGPAYKNTPSPGQNGRHFVDDYFRYILVNGNCSILIKTSLKFVPKGPIDNKRQAITWTKADLVHRRTRGRC